MLLEKNLKGQFPFKSTEFLPFWFVDTSRESAFVQTSLFASCRLAVGTAPPYLSQGWRISLIIRREGDGVVGPHWLVPLLKPTRTSQSLFDLILSARVGDWSRFATQSSLSLILFSYFHLPLFGRSQFLFFCVFLVSSNRPKLIDCIRSFDGHRSIYQ